jgi:hypothetical protein
MKKLSIFLMLCLLFGCKQNDINGLTTKQDQGISKTSTFYVEINIACTGTCGNQTECLVRTSPNPYVECNCTECVMEVEIIDSFGFSDSVSVVLDHLASVDKFTANLSTHVAQVTGQLTYSITNLIFGWNGDTYYIIYDYITANHQTGSVAFISSASGKYKCDCSGSCDDPNKTCRERYVIDPPSFECTCQSDNCTMTLEKID